MRQSIPASAFLVLLFACSPPTPSRRIINPLATQSEGFTASVVRSIPIILDNQIFIETIDGIDYYRGHYYLQDVGGRCITILDDEGRFIRQISRGKGPGELQASSGLGFAAEHLIVTDMNQLKMYSPDGLYMYSITLPPKLWAYEVTQLPNGNYLTYGMGLDIRQEIKDDYLSNQFYYFHLIDSTLTQEIHSMVPLSMEVGGMEREKAYCGYKDHYLLAEYIDNQILVFDGDTITGAYTVDFGKYTFSKQEMSTDKFNYLGLIGDGSRFGMIDNICETRDFISFRYQRKGSGRPIDRPEIIYSKKSGRTGDIRDILKNSGIPLMRLMNTQEDQYIFLLEPSDFGDDQLKQFRTEGLIGKEITIESNPVMVLVKFRENSKNQQPVTSNQ